VKVIVNWALCDGNGNCTVEAPEVFALDDNDELEILLESPAPALRPKVLAAVSACPKRAIAIEE
jgi:ferredoxin